MFKLLSFFVVALLASVAFADDAEILRYNSNVDDHGFQYDYETSNHIRAQASGDEYAIKGEFEWESPEGEHIKVNYIADENGYQPQSDALPTPPPVPEAILKAIAYINAHL